MPKRKKGKGIKDILSKANKFLRKTKLISTVGSALGAVGVPYAGQVGSIAGTLGYGRRKPRKYKKKK